jgi:serine protease Do
MRRLILTALSVLTVLILGAATLVSAATDPERGYIGVTLTIVDTAEHSGQHSGIFIGAVMPDTGAAHAGLEPHDKIVAVGGVTVTDMDEMHAAMSDAQPDDRVRLTVLRNGEERTLDVVLGPWPENSQLHDVGKFGVVVDMRRPMLGVQVQELTDQLAAYFGVEDGLLITDVIDGMPALDAGLEAGDVVVALEDHAVGSRHQLHALLEDHEPGDRVRLEVQRRGAPMTFFVTVAEPGTHIVHLQADSIHVDAHELHLEANVEIVLPDDDVHVERHIRVRSDDDED